MGNGEHNCWRKTCQKVSQKLMMVTQVGILEVVSIDSGNSLEEGYKRFKCDSGSLSWIAGRLVAPLKEMDPGKSSCGKESRRCGSGRAGLDASKIQSVQSREWTLGEI